MNTHPRHDPSRAAATNRPASRARRFGGAGGRVGGAWTRVGGAGLCPGAAPVSRNRRVTGASQSPESAIRHERRYRLRFLHLTSPRTVPVAPAPLALAAPGRHR